MKSSLHTILAQRVMMIAVVAALFLAACSKQDDMVVPCQKQPNDAGTRALTTGDNSGLGGTSTEFNRGGTPHTRGESVIDPGSGSGINDDGDDEADGEGNKKRQVGH